MTLGDFRQKGGKRKKEGGSPLYLEKKRDGKGCPLVKKILWAVIAQLSRSREKKQAGGGTSPFFTGEERREKYQEGEPNIRPRPYFFLNPPLFGRGEK